MSEIGAGSSGENMPTISSTEDPGQEEICPLCGGLGYVREDVPVGHPHFGQMYPCRCQLARLEQKRLQQLRTLSNLQHLSHMTFDTFLPRGHGMSPEKQQNLRQAYEEVQRYAENPTGYIIMGDYNLVGSRHPLDTMLMGTDLDGTDLLDVAPKVLGAETNATWRDADQPFLPGRLDLALITDATLKVVRSFVLDTEILSDRALSAYRLNASDTTEASDHLPVVVDVRW